MVGLGQLEVIQAAGLIQPGWEEEVHLGCIFQLGQYKKSQSVSVALVGFGQEWVVQGAGIWAYFSQGEGKWWNTKTTVFYFELSLSP